MHPSPAPAAPGPADATRGIIMVSTVTHAAVSQHDQAPLCLHKRPTMCSAPCMVNNRQDSVEKERYEGVSVASGAGGVSSES